MAWTAAVRENGIAEGGSSIFYALKTKEVAMIEYERSDDPLGTTDVMILSVYASTDGVTAQNTPLVEIRVDPAATAPTGAIGVTGVPYFVVTMTATGSTDTIEVDLTVSRDDGLVAP
jgi:hypothetical protein